MEEKILRADTEFLHSLISEPTPSSYETPGIRIWDAYMEDLGLKREYSDKIGNSGWSIGCGAQKVLISAHIDEIAMAVQYISEDGYLSMTSMGGIDPKVLPGSQIIILGDHGNKIKGVFCKPPIHVEWYDESKKDTVQKLDELKVSIGADSKEEALEMGVQIGSLAVFSRNLNVEFGKDKILGNGLDDKIGIYIVAQIAKFLKEQSDIELRHKYTFIFLAGTQEESGLRGLTVASKNISPDISVDFDVTFATDGELGVSKEKYGDVKLGKGCVIEYGQDKSRRVATILKDYCKSHDIPYQTAVSGAGGTNTDAIQLGSFNCETTLISIPNINMHTQNEICDWRDVESAIQLISGVLNENLL